MKFWQPLAVVALCVLAFSGGVILALQVAKPKVQTVHRFKLRTISVTGPTKTVAGPITTIYSEPVTVVETRTKTIPGPTTTVTIFEEGTLSGILDDARNLWNELQKPGKRPKQKKGGKL